MKEESGTNKPWKCGRYMKGILDESNNTESTVNHPKLQVIDSEEFYRPQTNMEVEYALTIQQIQTELETYKKENELLKQKISILEAERESVNESINEFAGKTKQQAKEMTQLKLRLEKLENKTVDTTPQHKINYSFTSDNLHMKDALENVRVLKQNEAQIRNTQPIKRNKIITNLAKTNTVDTAMTETLIRKQDLQNCENLTNDNLQSDDKMVAHVCKKLLKLWFENDRQ